MSNCKVIALTNQKGGVGKTTTAVNLGVGLAKQGKKVLLIDADAQANLTMALGYNRPDDIPITLSTVMQSIIDDKSFDASGGILHHGEGIDLLPSNIELSGFEVRLINAMSRERVLKTYVNEVRKNYDYVLIDCMPSLGMITINALAAADSVIIPTQPHYLSGQTFEALLDFNWTAEAVTNVLDNAVKYTPSGGVVDLKITEYPSYLRLDVSDNGIGIPEEEQAKIFGRFYRGKQSAGVDGVGIGLYLTRDIVNKQNGYIKVASDEKGTTFSLFLKKFREQ
ncbi:AAA family ATPase [Dorea longicatena]|uniref:AAA family ATPase n=1 Tax=Dorea longicatena TaxID=88431 RepID=UPI0034A5552B